MRYYLIAGEPSGDLHGANLMKGLKAHDPEAKFRFWGGDKMAGVGGSGNLATYKKNGVTVNVQSEGLSRDEFCALVENLLAE